MGVQRQALLHALSLVAIRRAITDHGYDWSNSELWRDFAIALLFVVTITFSLGYIARRIWPSFSSIDTALAGLSKTAK